MLRAVAAALLLCLLAPAQEVVPTGITCCDEQKIRQAMAEEALQRVAARHTGGSGRSSDYLSDQAYEKIRPRLTAVIREQLMEFLRQALLQPPPDEETREFQERVGLFVLGMTLEIGHTFQDEYDQALTSAERVGMLLEELEKSPALDDEALARALFHADVSEKELRRLRALERRWKEAAADSPPFAAFNQLKGNVTGRAPDPDQQTAFGLALRYRAPFPFLDEFLEKYRRVALEFRETVRRINVLLSASGS
jgi:hypothetical protein